MTWPTSIRLAGADELIATAWLVLDRSELDEWLRTLEPQLGPMPKVRPPFDAFEWDEFTEHLEQLEQDSEAVVRPILQTLCEVLPAYSETLRTTLRWRVGMLRKQLKKSARLDPGCGPTSIVLAPVWHLSRLRYCLAENTLALAWVVELETDS